MPVHFKNLIETKRLIIVCGTQRIEIFAAIKFIEFCPICGDNIGKITFKIMGEYDKNDNLHKE